MSAPKHEGSIAEVLAGAARFAVVCGDAVEVLRGIGDGVAAAVVTDPPSGISFMGAEWDRDKGGRAQWVAWLSGILADARRCTRDGGRSVVWSLPRTSHWTGCAVEDAGWHVENTITHLFGTGWPKGKSQLKPAAETWWLARTGRSAELNVEACRVVGGGASPSVERRASAARSGRGAAGVRPSGIVDGSSLEAYTAQREGESAGRYPPNVVFSHAPGCVCVGTRRVRSGPPNPYVRNADASGGILGPDHPAGSSPVTHVDADGTEAVDARECVEGCPVAELDAQAGARPGLLAGSSLRRGATTGAGLGYGSTATTQTVTAGYDTGAEANASRFFPCFPADPAVFRYVAKPSSAEKSEGVDLDQRPADAYAAHRGRRMEEPSRFDGAEVSSASNDHPTVKSVALMRWLVDLVTQRGDLVIDPFGGSGTTGVACLASGRRVILIERDPRFAEIARQRCAHWGAEWSAPARASKRRAKRAADEGPQPSLFDRRPESP